MTPRDFAYWLQGFFELQSDPKQNLTPKQVQTINSHIALVNEEGGANYLTMTIGALLAGSEAGGLSNTAPIRAVLSAHFEHVIDPQSKGEQSHLNSIHNGGGPGPVTRC